MIMDIGIGLDKACDHSKDTRLHVHVRWMIRRDMPAVLAIENHCFEYAWTEECFFNCLRQRNCIGMVAELDDQIVGFMIYVLHKGRIHLHNFAVHPAARHCGVGKSMANKLIGKLSQERRNRIMLEVRETNLAGQLFFSRMGFRAISIVQGAYDDTDEPAYLMHYRHVPTAKDGLEIYKRRGVCD